MAFFETLDALGKTLSVKGKEAAKKAKEVTEVLQLKAKVTAEQSNLQSAYQKAGQIAFESELTADASEYEEIFALIRASKEKIQELQEEIETLEGMRVCASCGAKVTKGAAFCSACGAKMETLSPEQPSFTNECAEEMNDVTEDEEFLFEEEPEKKAAEEVVLEVAVIPEDAFVEEKLGNS